MAVAVLVRYEWRPGSRFSHLDPQVVGEELDRIERERGALTAEVVVEEAADPSSPLHPAFEWNDSAAAHRYRLEQARALMRSLIVRVYIPARERSEPVRARLAVTAPGGGPKRYVWYTEAMRRPEWRKEVLEQARRDLRALLTKYAVFRELAAIFERALQEVERLTDG